jgi:hypothetical protein
LASTTTGLNNNNRPLPIANAPTFEHIVGELTSRDAEPSGNTVWILGWRGEAAKHAVKQRMKNSSSCSFLAAA